MPIDANSDDLIDEVLATTKIEYRILLELKLISSEFSSGSIYVLPSKSSSLLWNGLIFLRSGIYKNAILRFQIQLENTFPNQPNPPVLKLNSLPFDHPLISPETLIFDSSHAFPAWNETEHLYTLLKFFKFTLENFKFACSLPKVSNFEVVEEFNKNPKDFAEKARAGVTRSVEEIFNTNDSESCFCFDRHSIEDDAEIHQSILENMKDIADNLPESLSLLSALERQHGAKK